MSEKAPFYYRPPNDEPTTHGSCGARRQTMSDEARAAMGEYPAASNEQIDDMEIWAQKWSHATPHQTLSLIARIRQEQADNARMLEALAMAEARQVCACEWADDGATITDLCMAHRLVLGAQEQAEIEALRKEVGRLRGLLEIARCPDADCKDGAVTVALGEHYVTRDMAIDAGEPEMEGQSMGVEYGQEQCQWCYERDAALHPETVQATRRTPDGALGEGGAPEPDRMAAESVTAEVPARQPDTEGDEDG